MELVSLQELQGKPFAANACLQWSHDARAFVLGGFRRVCHCECILTEVKCLFAAGRGLACSRLFNFSCLYTMKLFDLYFHLNSLLLRLSRRISTPSSGALHMCPEPTKRKLTAFIFRRSKCWKASPHYGCSTEEHFLQNVGAHTVHRTSSADFW